MSQQGDCKIAGMPTQFKQRTVLECGGEAREIGQQYQRLDTILSLQIGTEFRKVVWCAVLSEVPLLHGSLTPLSGA